MTIAATIAVCFVAALHFGFLVLESFLWTKPVGRRIFGLSREVAEGSAPLAKNQGLYNGFLAAGLIWGAFSRVDGFAIEIFFLSCVIVAGIVGSITAKRSILYVQALPAVVAMLLVIAARS